MSRETPVRSDPKVLLVQLVTLGPTERMASLDLRALVATEALRVCVVWLVLQVLKVSRERRVQRGVLDLAGSKASKVRRVTLATVDRRGLVVVVPLVLRAHKASKVQRESVESLVLVQAALLVPWAPRASVARWASKEPRATQAPQVLKASVAATVSRATRVLQVPWAALGSVAPRATVVCRAPKATPASKAPKATRAMSASAGHQAQLVCQAPLEHKELLASVVPSGLSAAVVSKARGAPLGRWAPVAPRATVEIAVSVAHKGFAERPATQVLVGLVATRASRALAASQGSQVCVGFLV